MYIDQNEKISPLALIATPFILYGFLAAAIWLVGIAEQFVDYLVH